MSTVIVMPQLGESVAEGVIGKWLKNEGDDVAKDEPIVEVITDKVNAEIPSPVAGVLERITQPEGATVTVGQEIAVIGDGSGSGGSNGGAGAKQTATPTPVAVGSSQSGRTVEGDVSDPEAGTETGRGHPRTPDPSEQPTANAGSNGRGERVRSSPLVRRLAEQHGVSLAEIPGTGIGGRVSKNDILSYVEHQQQSPAPAAAQTSTATETIARPAPQAAGTRNLGADEELVPVSPLRRMIADRMVQSKFTIPHATTMSEVDMTNVVRYREAKKDEFKQREGMSLSYVAFVIKATVEALTEFPMVNAEWSANGIILKKSININVAVDAPEGLTTPVIHHADERSLSGLSKAINDLAQRARSKKLRIEDMQGGTFTVNNTGALGSVSGVSIINYPQGGILAAAAIIKRPVVLEQDGQDLIAVRHMMNLSFSFDHRLLDGGYAAGFVAAVKKKLEAWRADYPLY